MRSPGRDTTHPEIVEDASSVGRYCNSGNGPLFQPIDIGHPEYMALIEPDTAFWSIVKNDRLHHALRGDSLLESFKKHRSSFLEDIGRLRFELKPSAVYFNPTELCNLNCSYCYIPEDMRRNGAQMSEKRLLEAMELLKAYFDRTLPKGILPQIIFHGAEPLMNRDAVFEGIDRFKHDFRFGVQTNAVFLDSDAVAFLINRKVSIGLSIDAADAPTADSTRKKWDGEGVHKEVIGAMERLRGYKRWSVICTITARNMARLAKLVEFFHTCEVPTALMNIVRCTLPSAREVKPPDVAAAGHFLSALDRSYELYLETGRKLPIANFANILLAIIAPSARRLMCDISPCGGGRCFFAMGSDGDLFPCSEFIGLPQFNGGNLFKNGIDSAMESKAFNMVTKRKVEDIGPCSRCAIRHFCGAPCPAEAYEMNEGMEKRGAFCEFYEEQVRYAFRLIADGTENAFLWDGWDKGIETMFSFQR